MDDSVHVLPDGRVFVDYGPASMVITARAGGKDLTELICETFPLIRDSLAEIARDLPTLRQFPRDGDFSALTGLPRIMADAVLATGEETLTPMAAVAGTMADTVADSLYARGAELVAVNNGGDIAVRLREGQSLRMGILPDLGGQITQIVTLRGGDGIGGVCTSGLGGRSLTRGVASSVSVFASRCAIADACATHIANCSYIDSPRVHTLTAGEIEPESDIASLTIVQSVEPLTAEELDRSIGQVRAECGRQYERGNFLFAAADIQGRQLWYPIPPEL